MATRSASSGRRASKTQAVPTPTSSGSTSGDNPSTGAAPATTARPSTSAAGPWAVARGGPATDRSVLVGTG
ncbi:MAG: hypothetical protein H7233_09375 [Pseudorhodobacter sp.]|nr:hypothetical protein [Frankiaceae bacterium]